MKSQKICGIHEIPLNSDGLCDRCELDRSEERESLARAKSESESAKRVREAIDRLERAVSSVAQGAQVMMQDSELIDLLDDSIIGRKINRILHDYLQEPLGEWTKASEHLAQTVNAQIHSEAVKS